MFYQFHVELISLKIQLLLKIVTKADGRKQCHYYLNGSL